MYEIQIEICRCLCMQKLAQKHILKSETVSDGVRQERRDFWIRYLTYTLKELCCSNRISCFK